MGKTITMKPGTEAVFAKSGGLPKHRKKTGGEFHGEKKQKQYQKREKYHAGILVVRSGSADGDRRLCKKQ